MNKITLSSQRKLGSITQTLRLPLRREMDASFRWHDNLAVPACLALMLAAPQAHAVTKVNPDGSVQVIESLRTITKLNDDGSVEYRQAPPTVTTLKKGKTTIITTQPVLNVDRRACQQLTKHQPAADVEYQPGVDVYGRPVAPADLPGSSNIQLPETIHIQINQGLEKWLPPGQPYRDRFGDNAIALGEVTLQGDQLLYNGQPLTDQQQDDLAVYCLRPN